MPFLIHPPFRSDLEWRLPSALAPALAAATLLTVLPAAGLAQSADSATEFVAFSEPCLNLRPGPSLDEAPVRCLPPGRRMTLLESRGEWGRVRLPDDQVGWVALSLMRPVAEGAVPPAPATPETEPPETPRAAPAPPEKPEEERPRVEPSRAEAEAAAELREEVDDLTGLLRAAELFLSESEKQRLDLAAQVAALQKENRELRERLGEEPAEAPAAGAGEAGGGTGPGSGPEPPASGVVLPEVPAEDVSGGAEELKLEPPSPGAPPAEPPAAEAAPPAESVGEAPATGDDREAAEEPETSELMSTVTAWARAWSEQRVEDYLAFYADSFEPPGGMSRAAWEAQRRQRVSAPSRIQVKVALRDVRADGPTRAEIELIQSYSSDAYSDQVVKTLVLVLESGAWKIARETSG